MSDDTPTLENYESLLDGEEDIGLSDEQRTAINDKLAELYNA